MYMDMVSHLSDRAYEMELQDSISDVMNLQLRIIEICNIALNYIELYPHQKVTLAFTHFNYAVALSRQLPDLESKNDKPAIIDCYKKMLHHFEIGKAILGEVPPNVLSENGMRQFDEYIEYTQAALKSLE